MPSSAIGETFQQLLEAVGGKVETLGLPEGPNSRRMKAAELRKPCGVEKDSMRVLGLKAGFSLGFSGFAGF